MANRYINTHETVEQDLVEDLINEAIDIHSEQFFYIPRKLISPDEILGEDRLSKFEHAYPFDAYLENANGFEGQGFFLQKFGGLVDYSATITISRRHWEYAVGRHGEAMLPNRPCEGDLVYYPLSDGLFEIKFVDDKNPFAQLGKFYTFKVTIELFQYSGERFETENSEIDVFESLKTFDQDPDKSLWGGVEKVFIEDGGSGYIEPPQIVIRSLTGSDADFYVQLDENGSIEFIEVLNPGEKYHSEDYIEVLGECDTQAVVHPVIRTQIENAGDKWGSNVAFVKHAFENEFDPQNPFGTDADGR